MKILIIRRDNIGDLVCTTPLIRSLRRQLPDAKIEVLATRYNRAVLENNPDIDALHAYTKAKHRMPDESLLSIYWQRITTIWKLRRARFDVALIPGDVSTSALRFAHWIAPRRIVTQMISAQNGNHEVERCCHLLDQLGLAYEAPAPLVVAKPTLTTELRSKHCLPEDTPIIGFHISARKPSQRWPAEHFANLIQRIHNIAPDTAFMLLWAPGSTNNPQHPGDDEKAEAILSKVKSFPVFPVPTHQLEELIAALSLCNTVICADGGAMHLAAGLGKPIVALFGQSDTARWHPWGVPHAVLQTPCQDVADIDIDKVIYALAETQQLKPNRTQGSVAAT